MQTHEVHDALVVHCLLCAGRKGEVLDEDADNEVSIPGCVNNLRIESVSVAGSP